MNSVFDHYKDHLAQHYSWTFGNYNATVDTFIRYFLEKNLIPSENKLCVDLGCGSGFQSIALAQIGYEVTSIDICRDLLDELEQKKGNFKIEIQEEDLLNFPSLLTGEPGLIVCMGDTLTHLCSKDEIVSLFDKVAGALAPEGKFIISYRDLSVALTGKDRFIPVRSDDEKIFTCFLEYSDDYVEVFDIVHTKDAEMWTQEISSYKKLILPEQWVKKILRDAGFSPLEEETIKGMKYIIAGKRDAGN